MKLANNISLLLCFRFFYIIFIGINCLTVLLCKQTTQIYNTLSILRKILSLQLTKILYCFLQENLERLLMKTAAIFLDRDGIIIENCPTYIRSWHDVRLFPHAVAALAAIVTLPHKIIIVTNQSAVGRGIISLETARAINTRLITEIRQQGGRIDDVFMCPHAPQDNCNCRKPHPGLLLQAAQKYAIDLTQSIMIGDALTDIEAGQRANVQSVGLVRTGRGNVQAKLPQALSLPPFGTFDTLGDALKNLVSLP
ncbi:MAG: HAD family hydrolase [Anaerolineales bacterium]|nr:HAD family hydrolase [Anaerolineales bacterium]